MGRWCACCRKLEAAEGGSRRCPKIEWYFRHPWARVFVVVIIIFCNFLIVAEDPIAEGQELANIPIVGNCLSLIFVNWEGFWAILKVAFIVIGAAVGCWVGKVVVHNWILRDWLKLEMFGHPGKDPVDAALIYGGMETQESRQKAERVRANKGSWFCMAWSTFLCMFGCAWAYNLCLLVGGNDVYQRLKTTSTFGMTDEHFMRLTTVGTFVADWLTFFMVMDMMLQVVPTLWGGEPQGIVTSHFMDL